jgi:CMP-N-acetylneuraminic acid synthetase
MNNKGEKPMRLGVFMPGRLGSERLPQKLILPLGESNLWDMACKKLNDLPNRYDKYVLVYEQELIDIAAKYPNIKIIIRSNESANADGPLKLVFGGVAEMESTHLMFLNPCLSFLTAETIIEGLEIFEMNSFAGGGSEYGTSVKPFKNWLFRFGLQESAMNGGIPVREPMSPIEYENLNTKSVYDMYQAAHCYHIFNRENFLEDGQMLKEGHLMMVVPNEETIDVDTPADYEYAKFLHAKTYVFDIDGTICTESFPNYGAAEPIQERIDVVNRLYNAGNHITLLTARGAKIKIDWRPLTEGQLKQWGVKYHNLSLTKPFGDVYIDDRGVNDRDFFN